MMRNREQIMTKPTLHIKSFPKLRMERVMYLSTELYTAFENYVKATAFENYVKAMAMNHV